MILVIGGSHQGKRKAAAQLLNITEEEFQKKCESGVCVDGFHLRIRETLARGGDPESLVRALLENKPEAVVMDEVGCGVVPMDREERAFREAAGHAGQMLAAEAETVYRVMCGIPVKLR